MSETDTKPRRYGTWAGNPKGRPEDPLRCVESIFDKYAPGGRQCNSKRGHGPDGLYCKRHDPVAVKAKADARIAKWNAEWAQKKADLAAKERRSNFATAAEQALRQIADGHNDPRAIAGEILAILEATP